MPGPILALTQGDPAGIGPEILLRSVAARTAAGTATSATSEVPTHSTLLIAERAALEAVAALSASLASRMRAARSGTVTIFSRRMISSTARNRAW